MNKKMREKIEAGADRYTYSPECPDHHCYNCSGHNDDKIETIFKAGATFITQEYAVIDKELLDEVIEVIKSQYGPGEDWREENCGLALLVPKLKAAKECDE